MILEKIQPRKKFKKFVLKNEDFSGNIGATIAIIVPTESEKLLYFVIFQTKQFSL